MKYVNVEDSSPEALTMKCQDVIMSKLEYYIAKINSLLAPMQGKNARTYPITSHFFELAYTSKVLR